MERKLLNGFVSPKEENLFSVVTTSGEYFVKGNLNLPEGFHKSIDVTDFEVEKNYSTDFIQDDSGIKRIKKVLLKEGADDCACRCDCNCDCDCNDCADCNCQDCRCDCACDCSGD